jgi:gluconokinase
MASWSTMFVVVTGVSGSGKTTIGKALAKELGWRFYEGDDYHPAANVDKMRRGEPLTDDDRQPWLNALRAVIQTALENHKSGVLACSALKRSYRACLRVNQQVVFVHLSAPPDVIQRRLRDRKGHFMNSSLLASQLAALETPQTALTVDASLPPEMLVRAIRQALRV